MDEDEKKLDDIIRQMLNPLKNLPFKNVIEAISGHKILSFKPDDERDLGLLDNLTQAVNIAGNNINYMGIESARPNEVGNSIEPFVRNALKEIGYDADIPSAKSGKKKSTGYPDIEFEDGFGRKVYIECKTFNIKNIGTKQRSFYLSPSDDFKVTTDAFHFAVCFEVYTDGRSGNSQIYRCRNWKILNLDRLEVDVKYEFNSDNARMYDEIMILGEGEI